MGCYAFTSCYGHPPTAQHLPDSTSPTLDSTPRVNKRAVRILLECFLVLMYFISHNLIEFTICVNLIRLYSELICSNIHLCLKGAYSICRVLEVYRMVSTDEDSLANRNRSNCYFLVPCDLLVQKRSW